ncbi:MAG: M42 family metallopeptidase [Candidatus Cloacimonadales bacterium]|jgi:endoglucanase|nr:M42 family metallopeptidase [Candidatus Cloacimonadota bacterium]MDD3500957.1 M42 family metallopeptidase [Candidatus Cloacimonadota bacterium]MDX9977490.1 M42 family metallopeptidase [Candidatus Cloacimonadales bacterium]
MNNKKHFLKELTQAVAPSGQEEAVQEIYKNYVEQYSNNISETRLGSIIAHKKGNSDLKIMLSGHADEISLMVSHIDSDGFVYFKEMGGFDAVLLPGQRVNIHHDGKIRKGIIGRAPKHLLQDDDNVKSKNLWIDIAVSSKEEALEHVELGDIITWTGEFEFLTDDIIISKAIDNRVGVYVCARVLEELNNIKTYSSVYAVSNVQEEVGAAGAKTSSFYINPDIAIAIDVTFAVDHPDTSIKDSADIKLGKGPAITMGSRINYKLFKHLKSIAEKENIPYQVEIYPGRTGTDLDSMFSENTGSAGLLVSIPCRYMHSPNEMASWSDIENTVKLLTAFIKSIENSNIRDL